MAQALLALPILLALVGAAVGITYAVNPGLFQSSGGKSAEVRGFSRSIGVSISAPPSAEGGL
jgi:hypothetical protein